MVGAMVPAISRRILSLSSLHPSLCRLIQQHNKAPDYYAILGVSKHAEIDQIKFAYYNMAKKFHPDTNKTLDARQMFALIAEAYDVLSDDGRRQKYDDTGLSEDRFGGTSQGPGRQATDSTYTAEQMYETIFGASSRESEQGQQHAHEDFSESLAGTEVTREYIVQVSASEAVLGTRVYVQLRLPTECDKCRGSRSELGYTGALCPYCEGTGQETVRSGHITARKICSYCNGEKIFIKFKCHECEGIGKKLYDLCYPIDVPAGTKHGEVFRVEFDPSYLEKLGGELFRAPGGPIWRDPNLRLETLFVTVDVRDTEEFSVEGIDIVGHVELSPSVAMLGGCVPFSAPGRIVPVSVEPKTSSHSVIVVASEGVRAVDNLPGDLVLKTAVRVPTKLSWRQTRIWKKFASLETIPSGAAVEGITSDMDHRLHVNVITADKVENNVVKPKEVKGMDETFLEIIRKKIGLELPKRDDHPTRPGSVL